MHGVYSRSGYHSLCLFFHNIVVHLLITMCLVLLVKYEGLIMTISSHIFHTDLP